MVNKPLIRPCFWGGYVRGGWLTSHNICVCVLCFYVVLRPSSIGEQMKQQAVNLLEDALTRAQILISLPIGKIKPPFGRICCFPNIVSKSKSICIVWVGNIMSPEMIIPVL